MESGAQCAMIGGILMTQMWCAGRLGFSSASSAARGAPYGRAFDYIWMNDVK